MTSKKEILIETLHGSLEPFKQLPTLIDKETIYDETGHVDTEFLTAILEWMSVNASIAIGVQKSLHRLLGIEENKESKKGTADSGKNWSVEEILRHCTLENGLLKLPNVQFNRNRMPRLRNGLKKPADLGRVERLKGLHSRSIRRGCSQFLKKGSAVIFSRNTSFLKRRLRWRTGWLCLPAEYMKMIRYWNRVPAAVLSLKPFIELVLL